MWSSYVVNPKLVYASLKKMFGGQRDRVKWLLYRDDPIMEDGKININTTVEPVYNGHP